MTLATIVVRFVVVLISAMIAVDFYNGGYYVGGAIFSIIFAYYVLLIITGAILYIDERNYK